MEFLGGPVNFGHVSHLLNLAPGAYQFKGREHSEDLQNELGLRWRIFCIGDTADTLGTTDPMNGDSPWRDFSVDFVVPETSAFIRSSSWNSPHELLSRLKFAAEPPMRI